VRQVDQGFVVPGRVLGLSIHAAVGSWGGVGRWLAALIVTLDVTIVNVALPTLVRQLGATTSDLRWVVDTDNLAFAALVLVARSPSDQRGRKGMLVAGLPGRLAGRLRRPADRGAGGDGLAR
jgi:MFS family permease